MEIAQNSNQKLKGKSNSKYANNATPGNQAASHNYGKKK